MEAIDFVVCEDEETIMIYVDVTDEQDAIAVYFDLPDGMPFDPHLFRKQLQLETVH